MKTIDRHDAARAMTAPHDDRWQRPSWRRQVQRAAMGWFADNARRLPWRGTRDRYRVWLSEIMLQQTQVVTVIPYFERFLERFPTVADLAAADEQTVMQLWEGLGYYRRARQLHAAAKQVVDRHDGVFPRSYAEVLALPGVGRYTAGAILSIADGQRLPIVEANTQRLYSRLIASTSPPQERAANALLWQFAEAILPPSDAGTFNQAAMELGALVCTPKTPACLTCPLRPNCAAVQLGLETTIPGRVKKIQYEQRTEFALLVRHPETEAYLVHRVPAGQRWAGLWDFPRFGPPEVESVEGAAASTERQFDVSVAIGAKAKTIRHGVTRYRITLEAFHAEAEQAFADTEDQRWLSARQLKTLPLSVTGRKLADYLKTKRKT
ncbi:A/G-specific adenine glycosylase [Roseimaritima sediminicola]|uniref:A/G-specific adenine glycosylase n=1 Tax=Roseimaritima sediminicola TaxID=2662066 RepID=UPI001EEEE2D9|nr:A/G-specific adenine glycosylase [Roseimaritima sediminicola]